jgi:hypothetical protein
MTAQALQASRKPSISGIRDDAEVVQAVVVVGRLWLWDDDAVVVRV